MPSSGSIALSIICAFIAVPWFPSALPTLNVFTGFAGLI
jgi:hypothetical protein